MAISRKGVKLTAKEQKEAVMEWGGFSTSKEYEKAYDVFRNRVRTYEKITGERLDTSPADLFAQYKRAQYYGKRFSEPLPNIIQQILSAPAISSGATPSLAAQQRATKAFEEGLNVTYGRYENYEPFQNAVAAGLAAAQGEGAPISPAQKKRIYAEAEDKIWEDYRAAYKKWVDGGRNPFREPLSP